LHGEIFEFWSFFFCERQFFHVLPTIKNSSNLNIAPENGWMDRWMDGRMNGGSLEDNKWKVDCSICNHDRKNNNIACLLRLLIVIHAHGEGKGHWMFSSVVWTLHKTIDEKLPTTVPPPTFTMMDGWMDGWMDVGRIVALY
jgi:hypothetical protein